MDLETTLQVVASSPEYEGGADMIYFCFFFFFAYLSLWPIMGYAWGCGKTDVGAQC